MNRYNEFKASLKLSESKKAKKIYKNLTQDDILRSAQDTADKTEKGFIKSVASMYKLSTAEATKAWKAYKKEPETYNSNPKINPEFYDED